MAKYGEGMTQLDRALGFWVLGLQYLHLAECSSDEIVKRGNIHFMVFDGVYLEEQDAAFDEAVKWADHSVGIPVIFNFYHGLELCLKGLLAMNGKVPGNHKLSQLLSECSLLHGSADFQRVIERYIDTSKAHGLLKDFFGSNGIDIDDWFQALKYPEMKSGKPLIDRSLRYQGEEGAKFFDILKKDISEFRIKFVAYTRETYPELP